ncbi:MAG: hypothetical protein FWE05_09540 [Defluviitaleaceae bacterium]|nr:hypothetical protein [Defluviitaleaceae bacterium]
MARYVSNFQSTKTDEEIHEIVVQFMMNAKFMQTLYKGETVWKKGLSDLLTAPQYIKVTTSNSNVQLEAFITTAFLPGIWVKERDLTGIYGIAIKKALKDKVLKLELLIK